MQLPQSPRRRFWLVLCVLCTVGALCYAPALRGPFFFDDEHFILRNTLVHSLRSLPDLYTTTVTQGAAIKGNFYRPNQQLMYALLYAAVGDTSAVAYHGLQIALHLVNACLVCLWLLSLEASLVGAAFGAALFLLHPVQTEAVAYISGLADPLAAAFMFAALVVYSRRAWRQVAAVSPSTLVGLGLLMVCALFTKENAVVLGPLIVLVTLTAACRFRRPPGPLEWSCCALAVGLAGLWSVLKLTVFNFGGGLGLTDAANAYTESLGMRLTTFVSVLWNYAEMIAWPADLFYEKPYVAYASLLTGRGAFGLGLLALGAAALLAVRSRPRLALGVGVCLAALLPFVGIVPLNAIFLEHWLYVPMLGISLLLALLVDRAAAARLPPFARFAMLVFGVLLLGAAGARAFARNAQWADVEDFYLNELKYSGDSGRIYNNLGMYYGGRHDEAKALHYYKLAAAGHAGEVFAQPHHNLALSYLQIGQVKDGLLELRSALRVDHQFVYSLRALRQVFEQLHEADREQMVAAALAKVEAGQSYDFAAFEEQVFAGLP